MTEDQTCTCMSLAVDKLLPDCFVFVVSWKLCGLLLFGANFPLHFLSLGNELKTYNLDFGPNVSRLEKGSAANC